MKRRSVILSSLLFVATSVFAQPGISSNTQRIELGRVEWKRPVTVEYAITNTGNKPLVMANVTTSCACTIADWTKEPIAPGEKGKVTATFDAKALGHFEKDVCIYCNATPNLVYLSFGGEVVKQLKDFSKSHPYKIGNIAIDQTSLSFPDARRGDQLSAVLDIVNLSDRPYEPVLMHLPSYITMKPTPTVLLKGQRGLIQLALDTKQINEVGYIQTSMYLSRFNGDKVSHENEIPISLVVLPDFSKMTAQEKANAPVIKVSKTIIDISKEIVSKSRISDEIVISNAGKSPLTISTIQVFNTAITIALKKRVIQPGESTTLKVTIHTRNIGNNKSKMRILMIENDPDQSKVEILIKTK